MCAIIFIYKIFNGGVYLKKKQFLGAIIICLILFVSMKATTTTSKNTTNSNTLIKPETSNFLTEESVSFSNEITPDAEIIEEKTAVDPNYVFSKIDKKVYSLSNTYIRNEPTEDSKASKMLKAGDEITVNGYNDFNGYYKTQINGKSGYISKNSVTDNLDEVFIPFKQVFYAGKGAKVYETPSSEEGLDIELNTEIRVIAHNAYYYKISSPVSGYVLVKDVLESPLNYYDKFTKYDLSDEDCLKLARVAYREQGSVRGAAAEASLMCNLYELRGEKYSSIVEYVRVGGWFGNSTNTMNNGSCPNEVFLIVRAVLKEGKRTLPKYIDEHDCFSDIISASNNGSGISVRDRSSYVPFTTKIRNRYSSSYTFYCFPEHNSDPFGYTSESQRQKYGDEHYSVEKLIEELGI